MYFNNINSYNSNQSEWRLIVSLLNYLYFREHGQLLMLYLELPLEFVQLQAKQGQFYVLNDELTFNVFLTTNDIQRAFNRPYENVAIEMLAKARNSEDGMSLIKLITDFSSRLKFEENIEDDDLNNIAIMN